MPHIITKQNRFRDCQLGGCVHLFSKEKPKYKTVKRSVNMIKIQKIIGDCHCFLIDPSGLSSNLSGGYMGSFITNWLFTGEVNPSSDAWEAAVGSMANDLGSKSAIRGGNIGIVLPMKKGGPGGGQGEAAASAGWTMDGGLGAALGPQVSGPGVTIGGGMAWSQDGGWDIPRGGATLKGLGKDNARLSVGGMPGMMAPTNNVAVGFAAPFLRVSLVIDPSRLAWNLGDFSNWIQDQFDFGKPQKGAHPLPDDPC